MTIYFKGLLNYHFLFGNIDSNLPSIEELKCNMEGSNDYGQFNNTRWRNFFSLYIFNENYKYLFNFLKNKKFEATDFFLNEIDKGIIIGECDPFCYH